MFGLCVTMGKLSSKGREAASEIEYAQVYVEAQIYETRVARIESAFKASTPLGPTYILSQPSIAYHKRCCDRVGNTFWLHTKNSLGFLFK